MKVTWKEWGLDFAYDFAYDFAAGVLQALGIWCFIEPCMIAPGGVSGMAILINHLTGFPVGAMTILLNVPLFVSAWMFLNRRLAVKTIQTVLVMSLVLDVVTALGIFQYAGDRLISAVFGGILVGMSTAFVFLRDSTTGGDDILAKLMQRRFPYLHIGYALMVVNLLVIGASVLVFWELESALYGVISMAATAQTIDAILYGMHKGAVVMIHSGKNREIAGDIMERLNRGATFFKSVGGFSGQEGETLCCVIDRKQFHLVKEIVKDHDPQAFVVVAETKETYGEGFLDMK